jgi:DMSO/TMAO reductase YedYZ molybdopterin-dependent catalytic subunit
VLVLRRTLRDDALLETAMTDEAPPDSKLTRSKQRWASEHKFIIGQIERAEHERLPPGQHLVRDWPVLDLGRQPDVATDRWELRIGGMVEHPAMLDWKTFMALPQIRTRSDMHCVTTWSRYDNDWTGVATRELLDLVQPRAEAAFVMLHGYDGYTTNVPLADFAAGGLRR